ncbi:MAG TPA: HD domain-containing phosphohydrolase [Ideonella sp.]|uniref:HD-GYP domain-containing protein n=1 Tax=Ideonella sp. TaxID=1929293 RepID=UPI002BCB04C4|nr:HD domain-containing phosphohydrolase [Ideonella sp.]HSI50757.1 HD domain-containing phosphohydrolase [Ideonella sp.]
MVAIQDLRVGMFIHLDLGWMSHPFPLSSFKIASVEQIEIIRGLGQKQVRWSPERSDEAVAGAGSAAEALAAEAAAAQAAAATAAIAAAAKPPLDPAAEARRLAAARQAAEVAALRQCERQYGEACRDLRRVTDRVTAAPEEARDSAQQLTRAMLDKMLQDGELCVRVLGEPSGDRATAHAMNVTVISLLLARSLSMSEADLMDLGTGALLHDIGKAQLPDRVRLPRDDFSAAEQALYRDHVAQGVVLGRRMGLPTGALLVLAQHHEHADGSGFPKAVKLDAISPAARVVAMVNRYDNLCNAALPSLSLTPHEALSRMFAQSRNRFDATILSGFIRLMGIYPPGSLVQLSDERHAMVVSVNAARPLKPRVQVFEPRPSGDRTVHLDLDQVPDLGIRRSLKAEHLPVRVAECLTPRLRVAYFFDVEPAQALGQEAVAEAV